MSSWRVVTFDGDADTASFRCGNDALNEYLRRYASQDVRRNVARLFLLTPAADIRKVAGYFTFSAASVSCSDLPEVLAKKLPRYPIPVALLGRLAIGREHQGRGLGSALIAEACKKVVQASQSLAVAGIVVDAKDARTKKFYEHFGFVKLRGVSGRLLLPMKQIVSLALSVA